MACLCPLQLAFHLPQHLACGKDCFSSLDMTISALGGARAFRSCQTYPRARHDDLGGSEALSKQIAMEARLSRLRYQPNQSISRSRWSRSKLPESRTVVEGGAEGKAEASQCRAESTNFFIAHWTYNLHRTTANSTIGLFS